MKAFMITRDRVTYARRCLQALRDAKLDVIIIDHGSTWPVMVDWLEHIQCCSPFPVIVQHCENTHPRDIWSNGTLARYVRRPDERFIVTDCDVVPDTTFDWVGALHTALTAYPDVVKAGLNLRTDNIPECYPHRDAVRTWEERYVNSSTLAGFVGGFTVWRASVDTTLAMYRGLTESHQLDPSARTGWPYEALHLPWYECDETPELQYYRLNARAGLSHWLDGTPPPT